MVRPFSLSHHAAAATGNALLWERAGVRGEFVIGHWSFVIGYWKQWQMMIDQ
jgi:hypothetical protein